MDLDGAALEVARGRVHALGLRNANLVEGDAGTVELDDGFDAAVGRFICMYWGDPAAGLRRIAAHVRPGGVVVLRSPTWIRPWVLGRCRMSLTLQARF